MISKLVQRNFETLYNILSKYDVNDRVHIASIISVSNGHVIVLARGEAREYLLNHIPIRYMRRISQQNFYGDYTRWEIPMELFDKELS